MTRKNGESDDSNIDRSDDLQTDKRFGSLSFISDPEFNRSAINWINKLSEGDKCAQEILFKKFFSRLISLAKSKMHEMNTVPRDEEDVAVSAFRSFCSGIEGGEFSVDNEGELWAILFTITTRKACAERRRQYAEKRGGGKATIRQSDGEEDDDVFEAVAGREPSPELAQAMADAADELLAIFENSSKQRQVLEMKLQGYTVSEISKATGLTESNIHKHLKNIRNKLEITKTFEYLFVNLFDGFSLDYLAKRLNMPFDTVAAIVEKALELWAKEAKPEKVKALRMYFFDGEQFDAFARANEARAQRLREQLGKLGDRWARNAKTKWYDELKKIAYEDPKNREASDSFTEDV